MVRYILAATALKIFGLNSATRRIYRSLGNHFGGPMKRREKYIATHFARGDLFRSLCEKYHVLSGGEKLLEIGTGWVHWHSLYHRLFYDVKISMLDVWDCRQLNALQALFSDVREKLVNDSNTDKQTLDRLDIILTAQNIEDLYRELNLEYIVESTGSLDQFGNDTLDCIFSFHVLEHVPKVNTESLVANMHRALKPGGYSIHQIGIDDHLQHYDSKVSPKNYIRYSDKIWHAFFENNIQYFNRIQMSEWLKLYERHGFSLLESEPVLCDISELPVATRFQDYSQEDLECATLTIVHRKPI